jgi:regulator of RNase E activity RraA
MRVPPVSAIADVLALWDLDGWLTPPLMPFVVPTEPVIGTVRTIEMEHGATGQGFGDLYDLLSHDLSGAVVVVGGAFMVAGSVWGEILSTAAAGKGAAGVLVDGSVRDLDEASRIGLPLYARSNGVVGPAGRAHVVAVDEAVSVQGVDLIVGDVVVLDSSGCVRIPQTMQHDVLDAARRYAAAEEKVLREVESGVPLTRAYLAKKAIVTELTGERLAATARG